MIRYQNSFCMIWFKVYSLLVISFDDHLALTNQNASNYFDLEYLS
jgi:hypothetical protein